MVGAPNAGKSTLFNALTGASALVSDTPGTTRDRVEALWHPPQSEEAWVVMDLPGRGGEAVDPRDHAARQRAEGDQADLWWLIVDASSPESVLPLAPESAPSLVVFTQTDLPRRVSDSEIQRARMFGEPLWIHAPGAHGLDALAERTQAEMQLCEQSQAAGRAANQRQQAALNEALSALQKVEEALALGVPQDLVAEDLRGVLRPLGALVGELTPEDLLDRIFGQFCIGK